MEIKLETQVKEVTDRSVTLSTGETIPCRTVCWTAGVKANPVAERLGLPLTGGRISCTEHLRVSGYHDIWALGDIAAVPDPGRPGYPCPPTAQHAIRQARLMGQNVAAALAGSGQLKPFRFKTLGAFAELGRQQGVANIKGIRVKGFPAEALLPPRLDAGPAPQGSPDRGLDRGLLVSPRHRGAWSAGTPATAGEVAAAASACTAARPANLRCG